MKQRKTKRKTSITTSTALVGLTAFAGFRRLVGIFCRIPATCRKIGHSLPASSNLPVIDKHAENKRFKHQPTETTQQQQHQRSRLNTHLAIILAETMLTDSPKP